VFSLPRLQKNVTLVVLKLTPAASGVAGILLNYIALLESSALIFDFGTQSMPIALKTKICLRPMAEVFLFSYEMAFG
jgi:hypothetical protein